MGKPSMNEIEQRLQALDKSMIDIHEALQSLNRQERSHQVMCIVASKLLYRPCEVSIQQVKHLLESQS
ncbi:hypothetical protein SL034_001565 [Vibrio harveyi]|uniref:Uncharacterized protein n=1 Tax=Vibrio harveyi TaxID=669 RepID=A0ABM5Y703_VIBHA|nr:hypothetical protein [Vibrio harveyi]AMG01334.1 hypothetical protein AL538_27155 [Vibrio harveyi]ELY1986542.1 hypothetical protein [Vibrio harveyi]